MQPAGPAVQDPATPLSGDRCASLDSRLLLPRPLPPLEGSPPARPLPCSSGNHPAAQPLRPSASAGASLADKASAAQSSTAAYSHCAQGGSSSCGTSDSGCSRFESINRVAAVAGKEFVIRRSGEREQRRSRERRGRQVTAGLQVHGQKAGLQVAKAAGAAACADRGRWPAKEAALGASEWGLPPLTLPCINEAARSLPAAAAPSLDSPWAAGAVGQQQPGGRGSVAAWLAAAAEAAAGTAAPLGPDAACQLPPQAAAALATQRTAVQTVPPGPLPQAGGSGSATAQAGTTAAMEPQREAACDPAGPTQQQQQQRSQRAGSNSICSGLSSVSRSSGGGGGNPRCSSSRGKGIAYQHCCSPLAVLARLLRL